MTPAILAFGASTIVTEYDRLGMDGLAAILNEFEVTAEMPVDGFARNRPYPDP